MATSIKTTTQIFYQGPMADHFANFLAYYPKVRDSVLAEITALNLPKTAYDVIHRVFEHNVPGGKLTRGITVVRCFKCLCEAKGHAVTAEEEENAYLVGWCVELLQAFFLVADDIMDDSITRRGQPCWFRVEGVGLKAVNDATILNTAIYILLQKHLRAHPGYIHLVELFNQVCFKTQMGQLLDLESLPNGKLDLNHFTLDLYMSIVTYKTAHYSFYLPIALGMILAGITEDAAFKSACDVCLEIGRYFQIQDDFLDCYGDEATIGKIGTDIQDAKCSWLVVQALRIASPEQRLILEKHYGQKDEASVKAVKELYLQLNLPDIFAKYEEESYTRISQQISQISTMPKDPIEWLLAAIYKRKK